MTFAFVFPGQGSQAIGMGANLFENFSAAREVMQEAEDALNFKISKLMFEGPLDDLTLTHNTQPALMIASMMMVRVIEKEMGKSINVLASMVAGHSLGEYTALCAAGSIHLSDAIVAVRERGLAMQSAVPAGLGAMAAILGLDIDRIQNVMSEFQKADHLCVVANDNSPGQVVISGHSEAVKEAIEKCVECGAKRGVLLPVSAPFHSPLMAPAALVMKDVLDEIELSDPKLPVVMNVTSMQLVGVDFIKSLMLEQMCGRVRWRESIMNMAKFGVTTFVEVGSGRVLSGLIKRIVPDCATLSLQESGDIDGLMKAIV